MNDDYLVATAPYSISCYSLKKVEKMLSENFKRNSTKVPKSPPTISPSYRISGLDFSIVVGINESSTVCFSADESYVKLYRGPASSEKNSIGDFPTSGVIFAATFLKKEDNLLAVGVNPLEIYDIEKKNLVTAFPSVNESYLWDLAQDPFGYTQIVSATETKIISWDLREKNFTYMIPGTNVSGLSWYSPYHVVVAEEGTLWAYDTRNPGKKYFSIPDDRIDFRSKCACSPFGGTVFYSSKQDLKQVGFGRGEQGDPWVVNLSESMRPRERRMKKEMSSVMIGGKYKNLLCTASYDSSIHFSTWR
jgi:WD40 repeat protein